jgi:ATP-dependent DNA helicase RecG
MQSKLRQFINDGEGLTVEFKRCKHELSNSVFETVASFSNRYGGYILLGVEDSGEVSGVNPKAVSNLKKNFTNSLNNPNRFAPTLFLALEEAEIDGQPILWCYVPPTSQVVMFNGKIYDRAVDGDMDITRNTEMVSQIYMRKKADYSERKLFPYANDKDFDFERLMPIVRRLATHHHPTHPWEKMSDQEIIRSAGLYQEDHVTGQSGYNLAAVLLFGRDELILSCTANYVTDAICRREDLNRYDDRLMVKTNLIDAFDQLMGFIAKHTLDRFFLIDGLSVSVRTKIARELVSNVLVHREYTSAFPAKIIIERDRIVTENWSLPKTPGRIDPNNFAPYPKNPLLAQFFINIGRADVLGSGVRNLYQYTKLYSGGEPELVDGDVFKTIVPLGLSDDIMSDNEGVSDILSDNASDNEGVSGILSDNEDDNTRRQKILAYISEHGSINTAEAAKIIDRSPETARRALSQLADEGIVVASGANRNRIYRLKETNS